MQCNETIRAGVVGVFKPEEFMGRSERRGRGKMGPNEMRNVEGRPGIRQRSRRQELRESANVLSGGGRGLLWLKSHHHFRLSPQLPSSHQGRSILSPQQQQQQLEPTAAKTSPGSRGKRKKLITMRRLQESAAAAAASVGASTRCEFKTANKPSNQLTKFVRRQLLCRNTVSVAAMIIALMIALSITFRASEAVDCFKCSSRNGSNPACEDPFHNLNTTRITQPILPDPPPNVTYHTPCYAGKKGKEGLFPASACIKLTGTFDATGETLVVRHCALDSGTLTQDTELARMSHCGKFQFEGDLLRGCVLACPEDACNSATSLFTSELNSGQMVAWLALALTSATATIINQQLSMQRLDHLTLRRSV